MFILVLSPALWYGRTTTHPLLHVQHCWSGETARAGEAYVGLAGNLNVFTRIDWLVRDTTLFRNILENILNPRLDLMPIRKNTDRLNNILKE